MPAADSLVAVNGRDYRRPTRPTVVMTIDGCQPAYLDDGLRRGLMPRLGAMLAGEGAYHLGRGVMPSLTNPNNVSIVTGVAPAVHGIPGNHFRAPDGSEVRGTGTLEGSIAMEPRGSGGFGYDPVFVPTGETRTVAELGDEWKRGRSHRAAAARALPAGVGEAPGEM